MAPAAGPPASVPMEQMAIMAPIRKPMWPMSGVVWATHAEPRGIIPPEENPNRTDKIIMIGSVVAQIKANVETPVHVEMSKSMLNLDSLVCGLV